MPHLAQRAASAEGQEHEGAAHGCAGAKPDPTQRHQRDGSPVKPRLEHRYRGSSGPIKHVDFATRWIPLRRRCANLVTSRRPEPSTTRRCEPNGVSAVRCGGHLIFVADDERRPPRSLVDSRLRDPAANTGPAAAEDTEDRGPGARGEQPNPERSDEDAEALKDQDPGSRHHGTLSEPAGPKVETGFVEGSIV